MENVGNFTVGMQVDTQPGLRQIREFTRRAEANSFRLKLDSRGFTQPLGRITSELSEFDKSFRAANARVIAFGASAGIFLGVKKSVEALVSSTVQVEKALTDINVVLGTTQTKLNELGKSLFSVAKDTGQSFDTISKAAIEFSRQGLKTEEILKRTRDSMILTRLSGLDVADSVTSITAALNTFNKTGLDSTMLINKLAAVDAQFAVSSGDLAEAIKRVGSTAADAGLSLDQLIGMVTAAQQITGRGGAVIGNSFKTILNKIQTKDVLQQLRSVGIAVSDMEGNMLPVSKVLDNLANSFDKLSQSQKTQIAQSVGGLYQINILRATLSDLNNEWSINARAVETAKNATNTAIDRNKELNNTLSALLNKTSVGFTQAGAFIGKNAVNPALEFVLGSVNNLLDVGEEKGSDLGRGILKGIGNALSGPGLVLIAAVLGKLFTQFLKDAGAAIKSVTSLNSTLESQTAIHKQILSEISRQPTAIQSSITKTRELAVAEGEILKILQAQSIARGQIGPRSPITPLTPIPSKGYKGESISNPLYNFGSQFRNFGDSQTRAAKSARDISGRFAGSFSLVNGQYIPTKNAGNFSKFGDLDRLGLAYVNGQYVPKETARGFQNASGAAMNPYLQAAELSRISGIKTQNTGIANANNAAAQSQRVNQFYSPIYQRGLQEQISKVPNTFFNRLSGKELKALEKSVMFSGNESLVAQLAAAKDNRFKVTSRGALTGLATLAPVAAGVAQEYIGDKSKTARGTGALAGLAGNAASFASIGFMFGGGVGAGVGGILGAAMYLPKVIQGFSDSLPDLQRNLEAVKDASNRTAESLSTYVESAELLLNKSLSNSERKTILTKQKDALASLSKEDRELLVSKGKEGGITGLISASNIISGRQQQNLIAADLKTKIYSTLNKNAENFNANFDKNEYNDIRSSIYATRGDNGKSLIDYLQENPEFARSLVKAQNNPYEVVSKLSYAGRETGNESLVSAATNLGQYGNTLKGKLNLSYLASDLSPEKLSEIKDIQKQQQDSQKKTTDALDQFQDRVDKTIKSLTSWNDQLEISVKKQVLLRENKALLVSQGYTNDKTRREKFLDSESLLMLDIGAERSSNISDKSNALFKARKSLNLGIGSSVERNLSEYSQKAVNNFGKEFPSVEEVKNNEIRNNNLIYALQNLSKGDPKTFLSSLEGGINTTRKDIRSFKNFSGGSYDSAQSLEELQAKLDLYQKIYDDVKSNLKSSNEAIDEATSKFEAQTELLKRQKELGLEMIRIQKTLAFGGGADNLFSRKGDSLLNTSIKTRFGDNAIRGQGLLERADLISSYNGSLGEAQVRELIASGGKQTRSDLSMSGLALSSGNPESIAAAQILNRFKENIPQSLKNQLSGEYGLGLEKSGSYSYSAKTRQLTEEEKVDFDQKLIEEKIKQLQYEQEATNQLSQINKKLSTFAFGKGIISGRKYADAVSSAADASIDNGTFKPSDLGNVFGSRFAYNTKDFYQDLKDGALDLGDTMKSSFKDSFKEFLTGAKNAKEALQDLGLTIANKLLDKTTDIAFNALFGGLGAAASGLAGSFGKGKANGGLIQGFSTGGKVNGGTGYRDDVPAMLTNGEYVIKKSAVSKYGEGFLHKLNSGGLVGFDEGGSVSINLNNRFKRNNAKRPTSGKFMISKNLSNFALSNEDDLTNAQRIKDENDLVQYLDDKANYEAQRDASIKAWKRSKSQRIIGAYIGAGTGLAGSALGQVKWGGSGFGGGVNSGNSRLDVASPTAYSNYAASGGLMTPHGVRRYAGGGGVFGGDTFSDSIPAMLMGGEYVMKKQAVDKHGIEFFNKVNNMQYPKFAEGGYVGAMPQGFSGDFAKDINDTMLKLIESINSVKDSFEQKKDAGTKKNSEQNSKNNGESGMVNNISISIQMSNTGEPTGKTKSDSQNGKEKSEKDGVSNTQKFGELIESQVIKTIIREKKAGGLLAV